MTPEPGKAIGQLPIVPEELLKAHFVHEKFDTRFRACARLLQAMWRECTYRTRASSSIAARARRRRKYYRVACFSPPGRHGHGRLAQ